MGFLNIPATYANRNDLQAGKVTKRVIAANRYARISESMLPKGEFLQAVEAAAQSRAEIARTLGVPGSRVTELMQNKRDLKYDEAVKLERAYQVSGCANVAAMKRVLAVCLRHAPKGGWTDRDVERLAQEIEYGLSLLRSLETSSPSEDAQVMAERVIADRLRDTLD